MNEQKDVNTQVTNLVKKVDEHDSQIATVQTITTLGFIIALITLAGVVIAALAFVAVEVHNSSEQTQLLQEIKDKVSR